MDDRTRPAQEQDAGLSTGEPMPFRVVLTPYRSLSPSGFLIFMAVLAAVSFVTGLVFAWIGAWPVLGFFGLDVAIVYVAFRLNYRSGRLYETVEVLPHSLTLQRVHPSGKTETYEFQSYWARILLATGADGRSSLRVASHGREIIFGAFLTNEERASLADELRAALRTARQPAGT